MLAPLDGPVVREGAGVDVGRPQHARPVVEPQRAGAQAAGPGQLADAQQRTLHGTGWWAFTLVEGQGVGHSLASTA